MPIVGRLDQYASMLAWEFDETTANNTSISGLGTYYSTEFSENIVDIVRDGLVLNLDAGNLSSYPGIGITWTDVSGGSNNGTLTNGPTYSSANNGSIVFDGVDDVVNGTITGSIFTGNFTQSAWIYKLNNTQPWQGVFTNSSPATINTYLMTFGNGSVAAPYNSVGANQVGVSESGIFLDIGTHINRWLNIIITKSGSTLTIYCYKDGTLLQNSGTITWNGGNFATTNNYQVGRHWAGGSVVPLQGNVSNITLYNRALTATEIQQNYNALATRYGLTTTNSAAPMSTNVFAPYDPVYDEFSGTLFGAGQGRYMRQNTDRTVIVYNEIDEITDFYGRGIIRDGLVLDLDAGISTSYPGSGTTWTDLSVRSANGSLTNGPTYSSANAGVIVFDGTDDYITINRQLSTPFTITSFVRYTDQSKILNTLFNTNPHTVLALSLNRLGGGELYAYVGNGSAWLGAPAIISSSNMNVNQWYQVAFTSTGSGSTLYLNGVGVGTTIHSPSGWGSQFYLGTIIIASGEYLKGNISNTQIYNRSLTASEIQQNFNVLKGRYGL